MALLDRDGVYGAPRFHMAAKKTDIKAHIGSEITLALGNGHASRITSHASLAKQFPPQPQLEPIHLAAVSLVIVAAQVQQPVQD